MRGIAVGILIVLVLSSSSMILMELLENYIYAYMTWSSLVIGAYITAIKEKKNKMLWSLFLALPASIILASENAAWDLLGKYTDFPGMKGFYIVFSLSIPTALFFCGIGGFIGWLKTHNS